MKVLASLGLVAACLLASPALAGPAGTGLTFTEEVAKKTLRKRPTADQTSSACASSQRSDVTTGQQDRPSPAASACRPS